MDNTLGQVLLTVHDAFWVTDSLGIQYARTSLGFHMTLLGAGPGAYCAVQVYLVRYGRGLPATHIVEKRADNEGCARCFQPSFRWEAATPLHCISLRLQLEH